MLGFARGWFGGRAVKRASFARKTRGGSVGRIGSRHGVAGGFREDANPAACARVRGPRVGGQGAGGPRTTLFQRRPRRKISRRISCCARRRRAGAPTGDTHASTLPRRRWCRTRWPPRRHPHARSRVSRAGRSLARSRARLRPALVRTATTLARAIARATSVRDNASFPREVGRARHPSPAEDVDEKKAFRSLMERAGVKHQVRLASGARPRAVRHRHRGLDRSDGPPLRAPRRVHLRALRRRRRRRRARRRRARTRAAASDTLRHPAQGVADRNGAKVPEAIVSLLDSGSGDDRELGVALWLLWASRTAIARCGKRTRVGCRPPRPNARAYCSPTNGSYRSSRTRRWLGRRGGCTGDGPTRRTAGSPGSTPPRAMNGRTGRAPPSRSCGGRFALVASRAVASPVGDGGAAAAIMVPFFDMANHDDAYGVGDQVGEGHRGRRRGERARVAVERAINQGVGGPRVVLETTRGLQNADDEVVIQYDPTADNRELMPATGSPFRGTETRSLPRPNDGSPASTCALTPGAEAARWRRRGDDVRARRGGTAARRVRGGQRVRWIGRGERRTRRGNWTRTRAPRRPGRGGARGRRGNKRWTRSRRARWRTSLC